MIFKVIQDPQVKAALKSIDDLLDFEDWDLLFEDLPEYGIINELTFQVMLEKVRPMIKKYAKTPLRCRYVEKRMWLLWEMWMEEAPEEFQHSLRYAYIHQLIGLTAEWDDYPKVNPGVALHTICIIYGLFGEKYERLNKYRKKYLKN